MQTKKDIREKILLILAISLSLVLIISPTMADLTEADYDVSFDDPKGDTNNPDVDIIHIETDRVGDEVFFTMKVDGDISDSKSNSYIFYISDTKNENTTNYIWTGYSGGEGNYASYMGSGGGSGSASSEVSGSNLTLKVPSTLFSTLNSFNVWAAASHSDYGTQSVDWTYEWKSDGDSGGTSDEEAEEILGKLWAGSMLCIMTAIIIPLVVIIIIILLVVKVLGKDEGEGQPPQQPQQGYQQPPPPGSQQQPPQQQPPKQPEEGGTPPPPDSGNEGEEW